MSNPICCKCKRFVFRNGWALFFYGPHGGVQCVGCTPRIHPFAPVYSPRTPITPVNFGQTGKLARKHEQALSF